MKRIANTLPLLALTALLLPACSFSVSAGSGTSNPNPGAKSNGGKQPTKSQPKSMKKANSGGNDAGSGGGDASAGSNDTNDAGTSEGTGETPPKGETKPGTKSVGVVGGSSNSGSATLTAPADSGQAAGDGADSGATLTDKPKSPGSPGARIKSPN